MPKLWLSGSPPRIPGSPVGHRHSLQPRKMALGKAHHQPEPLGEWEKQAPNTHQGTRRGWEAQSQRFLGLLHSDCELLS